MKKIDLTKWKRKEHFDFFSKMVSPTFGIVTEVDCDECYKNSKENKIDLSNLAKGCYLVKLSNSGNISTQKLIKN